MCGGGLGIEQSPIELTESRTEGNVPKTEKKSPSTK
jgi:hypothetical protein